MQIKDYTYYHGTSRTNAALIMRNGFYQPPLVSKTDIIERNIKTGIGSLGIGVYAFCAIKEHALLFAHRKIKLEPAIISFKILNDDYILNFTIPQTLRIYNEFLLSAYRTIQELKPKYSNKGYSKSLDGAIIETFMQFLMQENYVTHIQGVYKTSINNFGNYLNYSWIPNSIELCLKDISLINHATIQLA